MADSKSPGFLARIASRFAQGDGHESKDAATTAATVAEPPELERKAATGDLPRILNGAQFHSPDGGRTILTGLAGLEGAGATALAFVAYWYVATRWRAQKLAEAPLMVVEEDEDGNEEWLRDHELAELLEEPSPDYDMGELLERTSRYLDDGAECLWVIDRDRAGRPARATPFRRGEFTVLPAPGRIYGRFRVTALEGGAQTFDAEQVCYFRDSVEGWATGGRSRLDVAMQWLRLGEQARITVRDLLGNAVWPSLVVIPDASWNPEKDDLEAYQAELNKYGQQGQKGQALALIGGGTAEVLTARIKDLVPADVLNRVESVVAAISGVPAIVLQYQVGMENSPWSQMEQARKMAYHDTIQPGWRRLERVLTRQLLRVDDDDLSRYVRFDRSRIEALQEDRQEAAAFTALVSRITSLNERRAAIGLDPVDDPKGDEIPELAPPPPNPFAGAFGGASSSDEDEEPEDEEAAAAEKARRRQRKRAQKVAAMAVALRNESVGTIQGVASRMLAQDAHEIEQIVKRLLPEAEEPKSRYGAKADRPKKRVLNAVLAYIRDTSQPAWLKAARPVITQSAERGAAVIAADVGINYNLLHPYVTEFASRETAWLVKEIAETTRQAVADAIAAGLEAGKTSAQIARDVATSGGFASSRSMLIARTEATRASAGGPTEALKAHARASGRRYVKTWSSALDDRTRDEHIAMEGETVDVDAPFSNGLQFPSEPNCRCAPIFSEVEA